MINKSSFIGQHIADINKEYIFEQELGSGAYGKVYRVKNIQTNITYACKKLNKRQISNKQRFKVEIDLLKATDHPYIVKLLELYEDNIYLYLIMEECKGGELFDRLAKRSKERNLFSEEVACEIFKKIMTAINYCHSHGVCHRDIKPENILFSDTDDLSSIKVVDFGLSRVFTVEDKIMTSIVGTTYYMSPEVINGNYNEKCDIWSAGCLLYIMLCGRPPFYAKNDSDLIRKINSKAYSFSYPEFDNVSIDAKDLITRMLCDENIRLTSQGVIDHNWIKMNAQRCKSKILELDYTNIVNYSNMNKLKKSVFVNISNRLNNNDTVDLVNIFNTIDKNRDGVISLKEARSASNYIKERNHKELNNGNILEVANNIERYFKEIDIDNNGLINYSEFLASTIDHKKILQKELIYDAFKLFDANSRGKLSLKNITDIIRPTNNEQLEYIKNMFDKYDLNHDNYINYEEFLNAIDED